MPPRRRLALLVATYRYQDSGLRQLTAPGHDAEALAEVLRDPEIADFDVTILVNEPHHVVGKAIGEFYRDRRRDDLTLLYFTGHGLKDDEGRLYLAMTNTTRDDLLFTALSAQQVDYAMESCSSRQKILVLDCCYSGAFPSGRIAKADADVHTLEKFQGKGRVVLTASDATQYSFEGDHIIGEGNQSVFTRFLVEGLTTGKGDLDEDGNISLDELYSYVYERVIEEMPQQRPKKQENVEGRIIIARNIAWSLPAYIRNAIESPVARDRLAVLEGLAHLYRVGNEFVRTEVINETRRLAHDDSKMVSDAATKLITALNPEHARREAEEPHREPAGSSSPHHTWTGEQDKRQVVIPPTLPVTDATARGGQLKREATAGQYPPTGAATEKQTPQQEVEEHTQRAKSKLLLVLGVACAVIVLTVASAIFFTTPQSAGTIVGKPISVGPQPHDVEIGEGFVWNTNLSSDTISRINPRDATSEEIKVGGKPIELGVDRGAVWVWNYTDAITRVDVRTGEVSQPITGGSPDAPISGIEVGSGYVWLSHESNGTITRINMQTQTQEGDPIAVGTKPTQMALAFGDNFLYVVNSEDNTISALYGPTGEVVGTPLKINQKLGGIGVYDGVIYVWSTDDRTHLPLPDESIIPIDERSFVIGEPISIKGGSFFAIAGGSGWIPYPLDNVLRRIDLPAGQPHGEPIKGIGKDVGDIEFADNVLWVSNPRQNTVIQIRPSS